MPGGWYGLVIRQADSSPARDAISNIYWVRSFIL
jgi:hypothetical protein